MTPFTNDIFISYPHLDNEPVAGSTGWIDDFHAKLKTQLGFRLGYEPAIWRDRQLGGSDYFANVLMKELARSKVLISILSPAGEFPPSTSASPCYFASAAARAACAAARRATGTR